MLICRCFPIGRSGCEKPVLFHSVKTEPLTGLGLTVSIRFECSGLGGPVLFRSLTGLGITVDRRFERPGLERPFPFRSVETEPLTGLRLTVNIKFKLSRIFLVTLIGFLRR